MNNLHSQTQHPLDAEPRESQEEKSRIGEMESRNVREWGDHGTEKEGGGGESEEDGAE